MVSTYIKRAFMRLANASGTNPQATLLSILSGVGVNVQQGRVRINTSADGVSAGFTLDTGGQIKSQSDVLELVSELLDRWDRAYQGLIDSGNANPQPSDVYTLVMSDDPTYGLRAVKNYTANWMYLSK